MSDVQLNAIAGIGQYLGHNAVELEEFFLHVMILETGASALRPQRSHASTCPAVLRVRQYFFHVVTGAKCHRRAA
jgi:hypothetical protein